MHHSRTSENHTAVATAPPLALTPIDSMALFFIALLDVACYQLLIPLDTVLRAHFNVVSVAWALSIYPLAVPLGGPIMGLLSDKFGRKSVLLYAVIGQSISHLLMLIAIWYRHWPLVLLARFLCGLCAQSNIPVIQAWFLDASTHTPVRRKYYLTGVGVALSLGVVVGPGLSAACHALSQYGFSLALALGLPYGILLAVNALIYARVVRICDRATTPSPVLAHKTPADARRLWEVIVPIGPVLAAFFAFEAGWTLYYLTVPLHFARSLQLDPLHISYWTSCMGMVMVGSMLLYPAWSQRLTPLYLVGSALLVTAATIGAVLHSSAFEQWLASGIVIACTIPIVYLTLVQQLAHAAPSRHYGWVMGLAQSGVSLAWAGSGLLAASLYHYHFSWPFLLSISCLLCACVFWIFWSVYHSCQTASSLP